MRKFLMAIAGLLALAASGCGDSANEATKTSATRATTTETSTESFTNENWAKVESDPDEYKGANVTLVGKVFQVQTADDGTPAIQMWADARNNEQNTIVYLPEAGGITDEDFVRVTGTVHGKFEGKNAFGADLTVPVVAATRVEKVDGLALASPAISTVNGEPYRLAGITIHPWKIEWAEDETRVFLKVENQSGYDLSVYANSARLVIDGEQFDSTYSSDYPELSSDLLDGARTSGVIVFPATNPNATSSKLTVEGNSENSDLGDYGTVGNTWEWTK